MSNQRELGSQKRLALGLVDQILSGASNILAVFAMAVVSSVEEFGSISLTIAGVMAAVLVCRGLLGTPITLLSDQPDRLARESEFAVSVALILGVAVACLVGIGSIVLPGRQDLTILIALAAPAILTQDCARFASIASGRPAVAAVSDGLWALGSAGLFALASARPITSPVVIVAGWLTLSLIASLIILVAARIRPRLRGLSAWIAHQWSDRARFAAEASLSAVNGFIFLAIAGALVGASSIASLRGAGSIMGPLNILLASIPLVMVAEIRRQSGTGGQRYWSALGRAAVPMSLVALGIGFGSVLVPDTWGSAVLGDTWFVSKSLLPVTGIEYVGLTMGVCAQSVMRLNGDSRSVLAVRIVHCSLIIGFTLIACIAFGTALSVASGLASAAIVMSTFAVIRTVRPRRGRRRESR